jgi:hypothetical protein
MKKCKCPKQKNGKCYQDILGYKFVSINDNEVIVIDGDCESKKTHKKGTNIYKLVQQAIDKKDVRKVPKLKGYFGWIVKKWW